MAIRIYNKVKIDSKGRILLPQQLRDYLKSENVSRVWIEQDTEANAHNLRWKKGE